LNFFCFLNFSETVLEIKDNCNLKSTIIIEEFTSLIHIVKSKYKCAYVSQKAMKKREMRSMADMNVSLAPELKDVSTVILPESVILSSVALTTYVLTPPVDVEALTASLLPAAKTLPISFGPDAIGTKLSIVESPSIAY